MRGHNYSLRRTVEMMRRLRPVVGINEPWERTSSPSVGRRPMWTQNPPQMIFDAREPAYRLRFGLAVHSVESCGQPVWSFSWSSFIPLISSPRWLVKKPP